MVGAGIGRREEHEDQVDRHAVDGAEVDRLRQAHEIAGDTAKRVQAAMWNGDAIAEAGGPQPLPLVQGGEHALVGHADPAPRNGGELVKQRLLIGSRERIVDGVRRQDA